MNYGTLVGHLTAWLVLIGWYIRSFTWVAVAWWVVTLPCILYGVAPCRSNLVEQHHWNEWPSVSDVLGWWWFFLLLEARFLSTVLWLSRWQNLSGHRPHVATRGPATDSERSMWLHRGDEVPPKADGDYRRPLISPTERRGRRQSLLPRVESRSNSLTPPACSSRWAARTNHIISCLGGPQPPLPSADWWRNGGKNQWLPLQKEPTLSCLGVWCYPPLPSFLPATSPPPHLLSCGKIESWSLNKPTDVNGLESLESIRRPVSISLLSVWGYQFKPFKATLLGAAGERSNAVGFGFQPVAWEPSHQLCLEATLSPVGRSTLTWFSSLCWRLPSWAAELSPLELCKT